MFTPAMSAFSTSRPSVISENAVSTQVFGPPFLKRCPFADDTTTGLTPRVTTPGACADVRVPATAATLAAVPESTNSRRFSFFMAGGSWDGKAISCRSQLLASSNHVPLPDGLLDETSHLLVHAIEVLFRCQRVELRKPLAFPVKANARRGWVGTPGARSGIGGRHLRPGVPLLVDERRIDGEHE